MPSLPTILSAVVLFVQVIHQHFGSRLLFLRYRLYSVLVVIGGSWCLVSALLADGSQVTSLSVCIVDLDSIFLARPPHNSHLTVFGKLVTLNILS